MSAAGMERLLALSPRTLEILAASLREGVLRRGLSRGLLETVVGAESAAIFPALSAAASAGCPLPVLADVCSALAQARGTAESLAGETELVLSGPDVPGVHVVDTATVARSLFREAKRDVLVCSYVVYLDRAFFAELAARHDADQNLRVRIVVDASHERKSADEPLPVVVNRFRKRFLEHCWGGQRAPELYHDPRGFAESVDARGVMHAKAIVVDDTAALVTSANFTAAAQRRNIEAGVLLHSPHQIKKLRTYFEGLVARGDLVLTR